MTNKEKACARSKRHYIENRDKKLAYQKKYNEENKEKLIKYREANKEKSALQIKSWRENNKEHVKQYNKEYKRVYYKRGANKEESKAYNKKYYRANKERIREAAKEYTATHIEENRARAAAWYKENPERGKANAKVANHKRRAHVAKVGGKFTKADIRNMYMSQGARCYYCSVSIERVYHIEHMVPISRGGSNWIDNICLACVPCNRMKGIRTAKEFMNG